MTSGTSPVSAEYSKLPARVRLVARADGVTVARYEFTRGRITLGSAPGNDVVIEHPTVSRRHLELSREGEALYVKDLQSMNGTRLAGSRIGEAFVSVGHVLLVGLVELRLESGDEPEAVRFGGLEARSAVMRAAIEQLEALTHAPAPVVLLGEPGTDHAAAARALHLAGPRTERPFERVDCKTATAAELFGHSQDALQGVDRERRGALSRAGGGTVFFDGLEALPVELHQPLARALREGLVRRLGDGRARTLEARVIAATTDEASVPPPLLAPFASARVRLPALRERRDDLPLLVRGILEQLGPRARGFSLSPETLSQLDAHHWPGNVDELRDFIEKALALGRVPSPAATIGDDDDEGAADAAAEPPPPETPLDYRQAREAALASFEREYVGHLLRTFDGNVSKASREAGLDRAYLHRLIKRHGLDAK
ncbi:MAG: sigma 54-interacting transcriptional regulator [Myxococcaceae bacterium]|jgi:DNA-binding NtrC family response regulator|nr:sigma 54-interacting transcriptional regulator [Myxococcaceae bacterium]MCA3016194.1 sigma 54-interacting transcriptional regulator [Myxococcaceae bacterium]